MEKVEHGDVGGDITLKGALIPLYPLRTSEEVEYPHYTAWPVCCSIVTVVSTAWSCPRCKVLVPTTPVASVASTYVRV